MQTYEDLETLIAGPVIDDEGNRFGGLRTTIDHIVGSNLTLRGEVADAMGILRETMDMKCLNVEGRPALIATRLAGALKALHSENQPTTWLLAAIDEVNARPVVEDAPALEAASFEAVAPVIVDEEPFVEPPPPVTDDEADPEDEPEKVPEPVDWHAYALALQAQLRANKVEPIREDAADYVQAIAESLVFGSPANPEHPVPNFAIPADVQRIDGVSEV